LDIRIKYYVIDKINYWIIFYKYTPWLWKIKLNIELIIYIKHETYSTIIMSHLKEIIQNKFSNYLQIYTDASKSPHGTGFAIIKYSAYFGSFYCLISRALVITIENWRLVNDNIKWNKIFKLRHLLNLM